jgi:hypothetical protein
MLLSPVVVVVVVCVFLFLIYFPEELGFIKNIEKERKKEREKKIRNYNPLLLLLLLLLLLFLLSINNYVSSFALIQQVSELRFLSFRFKPTLQLCMDYGPPFLRTHVVMFNVCYYHCILLDPGTLATTQ